MESRISSNWGECLRINLSDRTVSKVSIPDSVQRKFIGGRGLGAAYLFKEVPKGVDPLGPDNKLFLLAGTLAGTKAMGFGRWIAMTKSPQTGGVARAVGGGNFAAFIKFAGYDFILIEGASNTPCYIVVDEKGAEIKTADDLWGLDTQETQKVLSQKHSKRAQTACIGPAGENLVRYATITHGTRTASRCGVGTVMGSKKLKAVTILAKPNIIVPQNPIFEKLLEEHGNILKRHKRRVKMHMFGTTFLAQMTREMGILPMKNFQTGALQGVDNLFTDSYAAMRKGSHGCFNCITRCGQIHEVKEGPYRGSRSEGPEYETIWAFGPQVGNTEVGATVEADRMCDALGLDTISAGSAIGFAMELYQRGIITKEDTGGLELNWGDHKLILQLIDMIAHKEGFGKILAEGTKRAADIIGKESDKYAIHAKGLELPAYDPRAAKIHGLSMATSNIGGSHMYGYARQEISGKGDPRKIDRFADTGNGDIAAYNQIDKAVEETGILCNFADSGMTKDLYARMLSAGSGFQEVGDLEYLNKVGERIICMERLFNYRDGFSRADDTLPTRMMTEPLENAGPATGQLVRNLDTLLDEYYSYLGYTHDGKPSADKIKELDLVEEAADLYKL